MIPRIGASPWSQWNLAVTGINASPENPGPGCAVARCLSEASGFRGRVLGLGYETLDGLSILREVRKASDLPVIMVTARVEEIDRLLGLELGADDYVCKPYSPREVVARVKTVLRRSHPRDQGTPAPVQAPLVEIDAEGWQARCGGRNLSLTPKEFLLLQALVSRPGQVFSRTRLLDLIYEDNLDVSERAVDSHMKNLRRKLAQIEPEREIIRSVYGVGFVFED